MSDEELALLRSVCEQPDDDTVRLVYADWLDERGDPLLAAWAAFIRMSVEHARTPDAFAVPGLVVEGDRRWKGYQAHSLLLKQFDRTHPKRGREKTVMGNAIAVRLLGAPGEQGYSKSEWWDRGFPSFVRLPSVAAWKRAAGKDLFAERLFDRVPLCRCRVANRGPVHESFAWSRGDGPEISKQRWAWFPAARGMLRGPTDLPIEVFALLPDWNEAQTSQDAIKAAEMAFVDAGRKACGLAPRFFSPKAEVKP